MLSTAASRTTPRARALQSRSTRLSALAPSSSVLLQSRQCRDFCFGSWSSYFHPESQRDGRRRHRMVRYRYLESLNRNLSWDNNLRAENSKGAMKKAMAQFARAAEARAHGKYTNLNDVKSWSDDFSGVRPGKNIEDVERSAIDHLFSGDKKAPYDFDLWKAPLNNIRNYMKHHKPVEVAPVDVLHATASDGQDTFIDPITNRRITRKSSQYNDLDKYEPASFDEAHPPESSSPKYEDLGKYGPAEDVAADKTQSEQAKYEDVDKYGPVRWNEPDGLRKTTPEEDSKNYEDLDKYSPSKLDSPFTQRKLTPEEQSKMYDDLDKYGAPVHWNEPDGLRKETPEELSKNYDDLHKYGAVHWNEPDGLRKLTPEELSKNYQDLGKYGPVVWSEPDGLRRLTPEEESKNYEDLDAYSAPFTAKDSVLKAHEAAQMDRTVKGKPLPAKVDMPSEDLTEKYDDLHKYGPVHWNEPDGLRKLTPEELSKNYEDLHLYGAVQWNEPDGLRKLTPEELSKQYRDVPLYAPRDLAGASKRIHPEEASKSYKDLPMYKEYENGDSATARMHPEEASKQYGDLGKYAQYGNAGPEVERIHPEEASKQYKDLSKYPTAGFEEAEKTQHVHPEELTKNYQDLDNYKPSVFDDPTKALPVHPEEATKAYKDLNSYNAIRHNEPNGKPASMVDPVAHGLKDFDSKAGSHDMDNGPITYLRETNRFYPESSESDVDSVDNLTAHDIRMATLRRAGEVSGALQSEATQPEPKVQLTGNYARDFPEDFTASWSKENSPSKSTLYPTGQAEASSTAGVASVDAESDGPAISSMDESFPLNEGRLQPALDRYSDKLFKVSEDPYSHIPQGLETSFSEECDGQDTLPTVEKHWAGAGNAEADEPAVYKILAYDTASQTMNIAEATSTIHDETAPTAPADALIRLANPSKFLPHFKSLEAQGYEIVSGSGDVLIFRKVRAASPAGDASVFEPSSSSMPINPIDLMGRTAVGNFASPTGYVNYDYMDESKAKPAPPYRSGVDKEDDSEVVKPKPAKERKKSSLGKKMALGTVWVAGSAYAVGVMGEYFSARGFEAEARPRRM